MCIWISFSEFKEESGSLTAEEQDKLIPMKNNLSLSFCQVLLARVLFARDNSFVENLRTFLKILEKQNYIVIHDIT